MPYAIKIGKRHKDHYAYPEKQVRDGKLYVNRTLEKYTTLEKCKKWPTREDAIAHVTEPWEIVVKC